ncbi:MAG: sugar nucleotide-binding protein [Caldisericota bacterium]|nr:sugar nucleotide-binding protein [Caldisericota bacterium]
MAKWGVTKPVRLLLIGSGGQVGGEILRLGWPVPVDIVAPVRAQLDIAHPMQVTALLKEGMFDVAINCAAYTVVDKAETDVEAAWRLNAVWPAVLASETGWLGIPIVRVSTDYVFDGSKPGLESDPIRPLSLP